LLPGGGMRMMSAMTEAAVLIIKMKSYTIDKDFIKEFLKIFVLKWKMEGNRE
jgi:hypothetical protein